MDLAVPLGPLHHPVHYTGPFLLRFSPPRLVARHPGPPRRPVLHARQERSVEPQRERGGRVPELALHHPHRHPGPEREHRPVVAGGVHLEPVGEAERVHRLPVPVPDHVHPEAGEEPRAGQERLDVLAHDGPAPVAHRHHAVAGMRLGPGGPNLLCRLPHVGPREPERRADLDPSGIVGALRAELSVHGGQIEAARRLVERGGVTYEMDTGGIGGIGGHDEDGPSGPLSDAQAARFAELQAFIERGRQSAAGLISEVEALGVTLTATRATFPPACPLRSGK